jgi:hypothetical protein
MNGIDKICCWTLWERSSFRNALDGGGISAKLPSGDRGFGQRWNKKKKITGWWRWACLAHAMFWAPEYRVLVNAQSPFKFNR